MVTKVIYFTLILFGIILLLDSAFWTYFTLAGGTEREIIANSAYPYSAHFIRLMFTYQIPSIFYRSWLGIIFIFIPLLMAIAKRRRRK